ncbi:MAG: isocitrate/isopropylmalate family dehydrogenase [Actinomycetota bacterium]|nr:isocitrate/isopropylmalate family dehydrogenase [Actinomycetota bacterium]
MTTRRISVLPGDGIGPEVIHVALDELSDHCEIEMLDVGAERYLSTGRLLEDEDLATIRESDALLFGAIGDPRVPDGVLERGVLLRLRKELDLYVNLRPFPELGVTFVRENTEGPYSGVGSREPNTATETSVNTRAAIERCARYAFELAARGGSRLTWVHKTNVLVHAGSLWSEVVKEISQDFPEVPLSYQHADAAAYLLVMEPERFDVVLTDNLFGDLLSDLAAGLSGGLGSAASANLHPEPATRPSRCIGMFEPVHGSAPDIAGTGKADPTAAVRAAQMLIEALDKEPVTISRDGQ